MPHRHIGCGGVVDASSARAASRAAAPRGQRVGDRPEGRDNSPTAAQGARAATSGMPVRCCMHDAFVASVAGCMMHSLLLLLVLLCILRNIPGGIFNNRYHPGGPLTQNKDEIAILFFVEETYRSLGSCE